MAEREAIVLVHGLWMHGAAMWLMKRRLARRGYDARAYSYPTVRASLTENAQRLERYCRELGATRIHFVAHSMGGLVSLAAAARLPPAMCGRIVLIGTPLADCFSGRRLERSPAGRRLLGRCMAEWLQAERAQALDGFEVGAIAGSGAMGMGRVIARGLPQPHDGVVSVHETQLPGLRDHVVVPISHSTMLVSAAVLRQICAFVREGAFTRTPESA